MLCREIEWKLGFRLRRFMLPRLGWIRVSKRSHRNSQSMYKYLGDYICRCIFFLEQFGSASTYPIYYVTTPGTSSICSSLLVVYPTSEAYDRVKIYAHPSGHQRVYRSVHRRWNTRRHKDIFRWQSYLSESSNSRSEQA